MGKIIVMFENEDEELNMSLYDFIDEQYRKANPIIVCHVTEEEYSNMKKQIKSGCLNERLPRITDDQERGYDKFRYVVAYNSIENNLLISDYDNPEKIGNYTIDMDGIHIMKKDIKLPIILMHADLHFSGLKYIQQKAIMILLHIMNQYH